MRNRVRDLRTARGWTQVDLAERLDVSRQTVIAIERERYDPSLPLAFAIADTFGCTVEEVFRPSRAAEAVPAEGGRAGGC